MTLCLFLICDGGHPCRVQNCREWEGGGFLCYVQSLAYLFTMLGNHPVTLLLLLFLFFSRTNYTGLKSLLLFIRGIIPGIYFLFYFCVSCVRPRVCFIRSVHLRAMTVSSPPFYARKLCNQQRFTAPISK